MAMPTIGRIVWFFAYGQPADEPLAAIVVNVQEFDSTVCLTVFSKYGHAYGRIAIPFVEEGKDAPPDDYCRWPDRSK